MKNSLYPFFWQHGERHEVLESYMERIAESGMCGVCVEARPHPEFVQDGWWSDMDCIVAKAKELSMRLWILDDSHFPTGYANGRIKADYPQYRKLYLDLRRYDVHGPMRQARINLGLLKGRPWEQPDRSEHILGVYLARRCEPYTREDDAVDAASIADITDHMNMDTRILTLDVPEGAYSILIVFETRNRGEESTKDYLNPLVKEATQVLIDEVYEPHYAHYKEEFGRTIEGFFSDEPRFGNDKGCESVIGKADMVLPWREGLEHEIGIEMRLLPLLWVNAEGAERNVRFRYMDRVTTLYHENFTGVLARWCREHGVRYLGHNIEDNGAHARLGYGTGHYYRGQQEMDYAGIDCIASQIVPGMNYHHDAFQTGGSKGEFYHYALAKLASSAAHLDPVKNGRSMCEAFGAYGWNEGLRMMKWIADALMVRGINHIVPHAFNPKEFPDYDCPPHFYAHGHNPQFHYYAHLSDYMNRMMALQTGGHYPARVGLLYPAELEWAGRAMAVERPTRVLTQHQISFDIVTRDYLAAAEAVDGGYRIHHTRFECLVVPAAEAVPADLYAQIRQLVEDGVRVVFVDAAPTTVLADDSDLARLPQEAAWEAPEIVPLEEIGTALQNYRSLTFDHAVPDLVMGEYERDGAHYYLFSNENIGRAVSAAVHVPEQILQYDVYRNVCAPLPVKDGKAMLHLAPYETVVWIVGAGADYGEISRIPVLEDCGARMIPAEDALFAFQDGQGWEATYLTGDWTVRFADSLTYPAFETEVPLHRLDEVQGLPGWDKACGTLRFEGTLTASRVGRKVLDLGTVYETAGVYVNGRSAGVRLASPYRFDLSDLLQEGENHVAIEVTNTLGTQVRDALSHYLPIEPFGIEGPVVLYEEQED